MHKGWLIVMGLGLVAAPRIAPRMKMTPIYTVHGHVSKDGPVMTRDGRHLYYVQDSTELVMYDRVAKKEIRVLGQMPSGQSDLALSPQGDRLAFSRNAEDGSGPFIWTLGLDPATGLAVGAPKRVSMSVGGNASFSADGRRIAFDAGPRGAVGKKLVVVPAAGGPETVVTTTGAESLWPIQWSPDGQSIYFGGAYEEDADLAKNGFYRVATSGGAARLVLRTSDYGTTPGLSPDGRLLIASDPSDDSTTVATSDGKRIVTYFPDEGEFVESWLDNTRGLATRNYTPRITSMADLATGAVRTVNDSLLDAGSPTWSPDGRMVAAATRRPWGLSVSNADGSGFRRLHTSTAPSPGLGITWSPDGRWIAYRFGSTGAMRAYEVATGTERAIAERTSMPRVTWRSDSKAILYSVAELSVTPDSVHRATVHEKTLGGGDRVLATLDLWCPGLCAVDVLNDSLLLTLNHALEYQLRNLRHTGPPVTAFKRTNYVQPSPAFSDNGQWMSIRTQNAAAEKRVINVMHLDGTSRHTVTLPFETAYGHHNPWISPDGRRVIVLEQDKAGNPVAFHDVDVASGAVKKLMSVPHTAYGRIVAGELVISPDGKSVTYTTPAAPSVTFYEVDLSALLKAPAGGRGGRGNIGEEIERGVGAARIAAPLRALDS